MCLNNCARVFYALNRFLSLIYGLLSQEKIQNTPALAVILFTLEIMQTFKIHSPFKPQGDQPGAIDALAEGIRQHQRFQTLLGVTGSGKTFTMANVIERVQKPTLVISHNKTLAAQLYEEFKELFPENAVEYFVSYYDYYQPEAYIPQRDIYIEKDASRNDELDRLRLSSDDQPDQPQRCHHCCQCFVHLRAGQPGGLSGQRHRRPRRRQYRTQ